VVLTPESKVVADEMILKMKVVQKANKDKEKEMERLKKEKKRLKQKVDILFEKLSMVPLGNSESKHDKDQMSDLYMFLFILCVRF